MTFPRTIEQVMTEYQIELENWVNTADIEEIKSYLIKLHGLTYPDDWNMFIQRLQQDKQKTDIFCCQFCQPIMLAIHTISFTSRPHLKELFHLHKEP